MLDCAAAVLVLCSALALPYRLVVVTGGSMAPTCLPGDVAVIERGGTFGVGDVVLVDRGDEGRVIHRVVSCTGGIYVTRGDANPSSDRNPVTASQIRGSYVGRVPLGVVLGGWNSRVSGGTLHNQSHS